MPNPIDGSAFNQIATQREAQSKMLRLLGELAAHYRALQGSREHPQEYAPTLRLAFPARVVVLALLTGLNGLKPGNLEVQTKQNAMIRQYDRMEWIARQLRYRVPIPAGFLPIM